MILRLRRNEPHVEIFGVFLIPECAYESSGDFLNEASDSRVGRGWGLGSLFLTDCHMMGKRLDCATHRD